MRKSPGSLSGQADTSDQDRVLPPVFLSGFSPTKTSPTFFYMIFPMTDFNTDEITEQHAMREICRGKYLK